MCTALSVGSLLWRSRLSIWCHLLFWLDPDEANCRGHCRSTWLQGDFILRTRSREELLGAECVRGLGTAQDECQFILTTKCASPTSWLKLGWQPLTFMVLHLTHLKVPMLPPLRCHFPLNLLHSWSCTLLTSKCPCCHHYVATSHLIYCIHGPAPYSPQSAHAATITFPLPTLQGTLTTQARNHQP